MYLEWHPKIPNVILTGGQDCKIVAWNTKENKEIFCISTADIISKANWIPNRNYQVSSIKPAFSGETKLSIWHALKPNLQQYTLTFDSKPIEDYEWLDTNHVLIAKKNAICIKNIQEHSKRPFKTLIPSGLDFCVQGELSFVNDQLVTGKKC